MAYKIARRSLVIIATLGLSVALPVHAQKTMSTKYKLRHIASDFAITDLGHASWKKADEVEIGTYWNGTEAPAGRRFKVRMLWSASAIYVRFDANQTEPLVISDKPDLSKKTMKLWDRDVCEIFIAPDTREPRKYLEFEIAPTGEWIDLTIDMTGAERKTDWDFRSGMESAARVGKDRVVMAIKVPWSAFGRKPDRGDIWLGNIFRCVGSDPERGYLAWQPTKTTVPRFHVPEKFGEFEFGD